MSLRNLLPIVLLVLAGSAACSSSPTAAEGTVTVTQTTTTTTSIPIAALNPGAISTQPPGTGVAAATVLTFQLNPTGGVPPYTIAWNFGDGNSGAGASPAHVYMSTGTFNATAMVTDSKGTSVQTAAPIAIRNVTGRWNVSFGGVLNPENLDLVQDGTTVKSTINETNDGFASGSGSVSNPKVLSVSATFLAAMPAPYAVTFIGNLNDTVTTWSGTVTGYAGCPCSFTANRIGGESASSYRR
jgi:PKD repeat protein